MKFKTFVRKNRGMEMTLDAFTSYSVDISNIPECILDKLDMRDMYGEDNVFMCKPDIDRLIDEDPEDNIYNLVDWYDYWEDEEEYKRVLAQCIKNAKHYLVYAQSVRWDGHDGVKVASSLRDAFSRSYDATITLDDVSSGGKVLRCREASHDRPEGAYTYVIALTPAEYGRLSQSGTDAVFRFAEKQAEKIA